MNTENKNIEKKKRRWPWIFLACFVALILVVRLALMTGPVHRWIKNIIISSTEETLVPQLSIGDISGDLWNGAMLTDIKLTEEDSTVASIDTLHVEYNLLSYFGDALQIQQIRVDHPFLKVRQRSDSTWNMQHWIRTADTVATDDSGTFAFSIGDLDLKDGRINVSARSLGRDSSFTVDSMNISGSLGFGEDSYRADINHLDFNIRNTLLDSTISFEAAARAEDSSFSLEKLVIATAHSLVKASGKANISDSTADLRAEAAPLGWQDLASFSNEPPVRSNLNLSLGVEGRADQFEVNLDAEAEGIEALRMTGRFRQDSELVLTSFEIRADRLDLEAFMGDTTMPALQNLRIQLDGRVPLGRYQNTSLEGTLTAQNIRQGTYRLDRLRGNLQLKNGRAQLQLQPSVNRQEILAELDADRIWSDQPSLKLAVNGADINPGYWMQDDTYKGSLTFNGEVQGRGWYPEEDLWSYRLTITNSNVMDQQLDEAELSGKFNSSSITNRSRLSVGDSKLNLQAQIQDLQNIPSFSYTLEATGVNLAAFTGLDQYPSFITASVQGNGRGSSIDDMSMQASAVMDSSTIRGEMIQNFRADLELEKSIMQLSKASLKSSIADGEFRGRIHLQDLYNVNNSLNMDLQIKDLSSFAPVAGVEVLQAGGTIEGRLVSTGPDSAVFKGDVELKDLNYDNQVITPKIAGGVRLDLAQEPRYMLDIEIEQPTIASVDMKNIQLNTEGRLEEQATEGSFTFEISGSAEDRIVQAGTYGVYPDSAALKLTDFDLTTSIRTLSLQQPFHAAYSNGILQTDTLRVRSASDSAYLELALPYADSVQQKAYLKAEKLDLEAIQNATLHESYIEGMLFGEVQVNRTDTSLIASADLVMSDLLYEETKLDTLEFRANIASDRLKGMMKLHQDGELIADGKLDVPFKAENPEELEEDFFTRQVSGNLDLHALELSRFQTLLQQAGYENTKGILQFNGSLEGEAGNPELKAMLSLREAQLSDVPIDSFIARVDYEHSASELSLIATLTSVGQKALEMEAKMPLNIDLQSLEVGLPGPQDSISVDVTTNNFNLKALNDFLDQNTARNLSGRVDGVISIQGPRNDLETDGQINLSGAAVRIVPAGIRLDNIASTLTLKPNELKLANFRMRSGSGNFRAQGVLALEELVPGDLDFTAKAQNFKVANTNEYNGIIDLDMSVNGSFSKPEVNGKLSIINGFVELDNFGEKSVEEVSLDTTVSLEPDVSLYDSLSMDMKVEFNRRFFVRNKRYLEMELELDGGIELVKETGGELQLFGTLNTADGYAEPLGKRFELEEGSLAFSGPSDNPQINIRTLYEPPQEDQEIKIWYIIEGTVEDPEFKYESSPPMDLAGIISYTLFGQPFYKLNPAEQSVASSSSSNTTADFAMEVLMDRVESLATKQLGIDVVRIENTRVGGDRGTAITTGWYVNPKVFFAIQNVITGSSPTTGFYLEYYLREHLKLILSQGNDNRQGIDIQWEHDY